MNTKYLLTHTKLSNMCIIEDSKIVCKPLTLLEHNRLFSIITSREAIQKIEHTSKKTKQNSH